MDDYTFANGVDAFDMDLSGGTEFFYTHVEKGKTNF